MQPLATASRNRIQSNTNLSTSLALSLLDTNGNDIGISTNRSQPIELIIRRDPNVIIPAMALQNVTAIDAAPHNNAFHLHFNNITSALPVSVHIEMRPLNTSLAYLFIYRFNGAPQLNSSVQLIDGWTIFCPQSELPSVDGIQPLDDCRCYRSDQRKPLHVLHRQSTDTCT